MQMSLKKCPKCGSKKIGLFPNCENTLGCSNCGHAFNKNSPGKKTRSK